MAKINKIPCIKCTPKLWEYIKPYLKEWGYIMYGSYSFSYPYLVINNCGKFGDFNFYEVTNEKEYNRELITDVEEFLERAAKLKSFYYKRKDIMKINGVEIKPGMVIETLEDDKNILYVVFPLLDGELGVVSYSKVSWSGIEYFIEKYSSKIICIYDLTSERLGGLNNGKVLWQKPKEVVLTMDEIAKKFGVPVEQLRIKK